MDQPLLIKKIRRRDEPIIITSTQQTYLACATILVAVALERLACFSLSGNLIVFLTKYPLCFSEQLATSLQIVFNITMYGIGIFGGWISDSYISRHAIIIAGYIVYIIGYLILVIVSYLLPKEGGGTEAVCQKSVNSLVPLNLADISPDLYVPHCYAVIAALFIIPLAAGVVNTNLAPFGGDQIRKEKVVATQNFFACYYFSVNLGAFIASSAVARLQQTRFATGYLVALLSLLSSFSLLLLGKKLYNKRYAGDMDIVTRIFKAINNARQVKQNYPRTRGSSLSYIDYADMDNGGDFAAGFVEDIKNIGRMCRVFLLMIPYWMCYSQISGSLYLLQGLHMSVNSTLSGTSNFTNCTVINQIASMPECKPHSSPPGNCADNEESTIPATNLTVFNSICVVIGLPIVQKLYNLLSSQRKEIKIWSRLTTGIILAFFSMLVAGAVETSRLKDIGCNGFQCHRQGVVLSYSAPNFSVWWQASQYVLLGASEIFFIATALEYTYITAPMNMQGLMTGLLWFVTGGVGSLLGLALPKIFTGLKVWDDSLDINCTRLDYYFYGLSVLLAIYSVVFVIISKSCNLQIGRIKEQAPWIEMLNHE